ncbi:MAG: hypothetical protein H0U18_01400 [Pyrinomonadaceae bacterium]|nr:hypothetical protein [Pyrinomonadaceae bacterium]
MKTTNLFVELVVVGTGATLFVVLLLFTLFGAQPWLYQWISKSDDVASIIPVLSLIYVLGIVVDKLAYRLFKNTEDHLRSNMFKVESTEPDKLKGYYDARHHLYTSPNTTAAIEAFEFGRSKIRICRGWTVNSVLIILALNFFMIFRSGWDSRISVGTIAFGLLAWGVRWSWSVATAVEFNWLNRFHNMSSETPKTNVPVPPAE